MAANHRFETLSEMVGRGGGNLKVACGCGHRSVVDGRKLSRLFFVQRWSGRRHMIRDHLRCSTCGARPERVEPTYAAATGPDWWPRTEADWKRLAARLRG